MLNFVDQKEGFRTVDTGLSKFNIVLDRSNGFWRIETSSGPLPVALRDKQYTSPQFALRDIKNYIDGHKERQIVYKKAKKEE